MIDSTFTVLVAHKKQEATDICSLELVDPQGRALPAFSAGAHVDVHLPSGLVRQYSLCNTSDDSHRYLLAVLRDPVSRGGSESVHAHIRQGDTLRISAPKNHFALAAGGSHSLLLAGGIGVTPILCMAERLAVIGASFEMHYCTRSQERTAFYERIKQSAYAERVHFHFDAGDPTQKLALQALLSDAPPHTHLYVCGPAGFMDAVLSGARAQGWPEEQLHYEFFAGAVTSSAEDRSFQVTLASSGRVITIPAETSVVAALLQAGIEIPVSCEQGVCGTCLTRVLQGQPEHKDMYLTPEEQARNDQFLPCCSRARSSMLVLDL